MTAETEAKLRDLVKSRGFAPDALPLARAAFRLGVDETLKAISGEADGQWNASERAQPGSAGRQYHETVWSAFQNLERSLRRALLAEAPGEVQVIVAETCPDCGLGVRPGTAHIPRRGLETGMPCAVMSDHVRGDCPPGCDDDEHQEPTQPGHGEGPR